MAYCGAGFLPSEKVFIAALDPATGDDTGPNLWKVTREGDVSMQGYMLASEDRLYLPSGRSTPFIMSRADGELEGQVRGGGGTYALLTSDDELIFGPSRSGELELTSGERKTTLASFQGNHMIVAPEISYMQTEVTLAALDRRMHRDLRARQRELGASKATFANRSKN